MKNNFLRNLEKNIFQIYQASHINNERSAKKVDDLHYAIQRHLSTKLDVTKYEIWSKRTDKKELKVKGYFFSKNADLAIINKKDGTVIATIEFKFLLSSIQKNTINNMTNMIGEATNIQLNKIKTFWMYCIREKTPVYDKNGKIKSFYKIDDKFLDKYKNLYKNKEAFNFVIPKGLLLLIYQDDLKLENYVDKRDIAMATGKFKDNQNLNVRFNETKVYRENNLFINCYSEFIDFICEEVENESW